MWMYNWHYTSSVLPVRERIYADHGDAIYSDCLPNNEYDVSFSTKDSRYSDTTCQTLNPKRYSISRLDPKFLRALKIAFGLRFRYLCNIVSIFQAHLQRYRRKEEVIFLSFHMRPLGQEWLSAVTCHPFSFGSLRTVIKSFLITATMEVNIPTQA